MMTSEAATGMVHLTYALPKGMTGRRFRLLDETDVPVGGAATVARSADMPVAGADEPRVTRAASDSALVQVGVDLGRSETRVYDGVNLLTFPSLVGGPVATIRRGSSRIIDDNLEHNLQIRLDGQTYSLGRFALEQPFLFPVNEENIFESELNKALFLGALGLLTRRRKEAGVARYKVCLGVPVYLSRRPDYIERALKAWLGWHEFVFCGEPMAFEVVQIDAIPQPVGAVYAGILSGQIDYNPERAIGVIDPGHLTTDWVVVRLPNELTQYSGHTTAVGGVRLYEAVAAYLSEQMVSRIDPTALQESMVTGIYQDTGSEAIEIPEALQAQLKDIMAQQVALTVKQSWRDLRIHQMLLVGGFGQVLFPLLRKYPYFRDLELAEDPRYVNVKGFYEYALASPVTGNA